MTVPLTVELRSRLGSAVQEARRLAEAGARQALEALAVNSTEPHESMSRFDRSLRDRLLSRGLHVGDRPADILKAQSVDHLVHEIAYEHWHRMLFARFLAENYLLIPPEFGIAVSLEECRELARDRDVSLWHLAGKWAEGMLPEIFTQGDPVLAVTLPPEIQQQLESTVESLPNAVFSASDSLGWTYQYWRAEEKDRINKSEAKIGSDELPAMTQLFTERYMVLFLLHNTIGAWRASKLLAQDPNLASDVGEAELRQRVSVLAGGGYEFTYLRFVRSRESNGLDDGPSSTWRPATGAFNRWPKDARRLRVLDPCCGSGHFLVEVFELLVKLRMDEEQLTAPEAVSAVLSQNLYGLEIDPRCTQIAAFNVAMAAWRTAGGWMQLPPLNIACSGIAPEATKAEWVALAEGVTPPSKLADGGDRNPSHVLSSTTRLRQGMARLYALFERARELGSLIDPPTIGGDLLGAGYGQLRELFAAAVSKDPGARRRDEWAVAAAGMARAAQILTGRYTLVITNVPFLTRGKQADGMKQFCDEHHEHAKGDLATVFVSRSFGWLGNSGALAVVTPQAWMFLSSYRKMREQVLIERTWNLVARLGTGAFETISGEVVNVSLTILSAERPQTRWLMAGLDASARRGQRPTRAVEKAKKLAGSAEIALSEQSEQLANPNAVVLMRPVAGRELLRELTSGRAGLQTGDSPAFTRRFWEVQFDGYRWEFQQSTVRQSKDFGGRTDAVLWQRGKGRLYEAVFCRLKGQVGMWIRGREVWGREGIAVSQMGTLPVTRYTGEIFDPNTAALGPLAGNQLAAVWCFCSSPEYANEVREFDQSLKVTNNTLAKVPFDAERWTKVAAERYPNGLPEPYSDDPTQWIFHGDPCRSVVWNEDAKVTAFGKLRFDSNVLQIAVARLVSFDWPAEHDPMMRLAPEQRAVVDQCSRYRGFADPDGIVCLSAARGESAAADRLRALLAFAYGGQWSATAERKLLNESASRGRPPNSLEDWLRDRFFAEHCKLFQNAPFIWHIWDGRKDGFNALVNFHRLAAPDGAGERVLEKLAFAYLNDWIERQRADMREEIPGSAARLTSALGLQSQLRRILEGEPPCDLFSRWKPLHSQPIGWNPDLDDGVRVNIRPFMQAELPAGGRTGAGILRWRPNIKWGKDRGREPKELRPREQFPWYWGCPGTGSLQERTDFLASPDAVFDGNRWNDLHYTTTRKHAASPEIVPRIS